MRGRNFERLARKYVLPQFPQLEVDRGLLYARPTDLLLRGIAVDSSAFSGTVFYLNCFIQPLFVPAADFEFPFVLRLRDPRDNRDGWDLAKREPDDVFAGNAAGIRAQFHPASREVRRTGGATGLARGLEEPPHRRGGCVRPRLKG